MSLWKNKKVIEDAMEVYSVWARDFYEFSKKPELGTEQKAMVLGVFYGYMNAQLHLWAATKGDMNDKENYDRVVKACKKTPLSGGEWGLMVLKWMEMKTAKELIL